jgi:hypothetical protein
MGHSVKYVNLSLGNFLICTLVQMLAHRDQSLLLWWIYDLHMYDNGIEDACTYVHMYIFLWRYAKNWSNEMELLKL